MQESRSRDGQVSNATERAAGGQKEMVSEVLERDSANLLIRPKVTRIGALRAENLKKSYRRRCVVNNVTVVVNPGEIVGLLGPNGAGKTTTFYMVVGLEQPD